MRPFKNLICNGPIALALKRKDEDSSNKLGTQEIKTLTSIQSINMRAAKM